VTDTDTPGVYLTSDQARRLRCLAAVLEVCQGRSVHIGTVWAIARWVETGTMDGTRA
jgi:hypothetical protein